MKNFALAALLIATVAFATLYFRETAKASQSQVAAETLRQQVAELQTSVAENEHQTEKLRAELKQTQTDLDARNTQVLQLRSTSPNAAQPNTAAVASQVKNPAAPSSPFSALGKMFENPEMREAIAAQQKAALGPMLEKTYGKLFSDLHLTPDQAASLKEMLLNKQLASSQIGMSLLSDGSDPAKTRELGEKVKAASDAADAEIKTFLGDEKFAQLKAYEKTTGDRMTVSGFKDQLGSSAALSPDQEQQLINAMTEARQNFKFTTDLSDKSKLTGDLSSMFNEENVNRFTQEMDQLNQRYIGHAQNILKPDQLESFQKYLNNQQALQKAGLQMGAKMFSQPKPAQ